MSAAIMVLLTLRDSKPRHCSLLHEPDLILAAVVNFLRHSCIPMGNDSQEIYEENHMNGLSETVLDRNLVRVQQNVIQMQQQIR